MTVLIQKSHYGVFIALGIIFLWFTHLFYIMEHIEVSLTNPWFYLHFLLQTYLYTGLFITGHDAMHGTVSSNKKVNDLLGYFSVSLFACMPYKKLLENHWAHHHNPGTEKDPDFCIHSKNFWIWWFHFMARYITWYQIILISLLFNFIFWLGDYSLISLICLWILPAFLSTLQLFYYGTYLPHKHPHTHDMGPHRARTQKKNHVWAMISCYFFGYHEEHHASTSTPWWQLYKMK